ncbi:MAG: rmd 2 [Actinomycetia bacterium]|nr:rmd 2 [Actinomycetes bacterium]
MTWLITGGSGFIGGHVLAALEDKVVAGERVVALGRHHPGGLPYDRFVRADLQDLPGLTRAIASIEPDVVIHAAGKTPPAPSDALYEANTRGTRFLLDALRATGKPCRVVLAGSAAELGPVPAELLPADEGCRCRPADSYGMSKWAATRLVLTAEGPIDGVVARLFNPIGPGMPTTQAFGRFAAMLAEANPDPLTMRVGDLAARRDFLDVRDAASALVALAEHGDPGTLYHIGTGVSRSIGEGLAEMIRLSGRTVRIEEAPGRGGPSDSRADIRRIVAATGWRPRFRFETTLRDLWDAAKRRATTRLVA